MPYARENITEFIARTLTYLRRSFFLRSQLTEPGLWRMYKQCMNINIAALLSRPLSRTRFIVLDTETTGLHAYAGDEIVSIACLEMQGLELTGQQFTSFVNPQRQIPDASSNIHGITDNDVRNSPSLEVLLPDVLDFIGNAVIVGHHIGFDYRFLNKTLQRKLLCRLRNPWIDTMLLYLAHCGRMGHYTLEEVAAACSVHIEGRHSAIGDAEAAAAIFINLVTQMLDPEKSLSCLIAIQHQNGKSL